MEDKFIFRGLSGGKWYYGGYFKHLPYTPYCCGSEPPEKDYKHLIIQEEFSDWGLPRDMTCIEVEPETVGQCTGLKDKAGNLIFEGDIVKYTSLPTKTNPEKKPFTENYKIVWDETYSGWNTQRYNGVNCHCVAIIQKQIEIIGNIYQNPELLEEEE